MVLLFEKTMKVVNKFENKTIQVLHLLNIFCHFRSKNFCSQNVSNKIASIANIHLERVNERSETKNYFSFEKKTTGRKFIQKMWP